MTLHGHRTATNWSWFAASLCKDSLCRSRSILRLGASSSWLTEMIRKAWCCVRRMYPASKLASVLLVLSCLPFTSTAFAGASAPDWMHEAARMQLGTYPKDTPGVVLL